MEVFYNTLIELGITMKLVMLIKVLVNITYFEVWISRYLSSIFHIENDLKPDISLVQLLSFALAYAIGNIQFSKEGLIFNGIHQLLCADDAKLFGKNMNIMKKNAEALLVAGKEVGLEVNIEKI
jgi:hypothetical protein